MTHEIEETDSMRPETIARPALGGHLAAMLAALGIGLAGISCARAQAPAAPQTFKMAFIDQLSGPLADVGELMRDHLRLAVDDLNARGGVLGGTRLELLAFDNKLSAADSLAMLQAAIDQGARVVFTGGSGSSIALAMVDAVTKFNERNPGREVIVVNHSSIDPELTGAKCSFWHFAVEANTAMKMRALVNFMRGLPDIHKVYLLNQDYAHGRAWAAYGHEMLAKARPDVQWVGEKLHPIGRVKDFAPYAADIKSSGADTVITGNWGQDLQLLLRAAGDSGMDLRYFNHSAGSVPGTVRAVAQAKLGKLTWVAEWHPNMDAPRVEPIAAAYRARFGKEFLAPRIDLAPRLVAAAIEKARSLEALKIAAALESIGFDSSVGPVSFRRDDHQLLLPQTVSTVAPVDGKTVRVGVEGTNYGFRTDATYPGRELIGPTECRMRRPAGA